MIPVVCRKAPKGFNRRVWQPGRAHLASINHPFIGPLRLGAQLKPFWRLVLGVLRRRHGGICAYTALHVPQVTGAHTVDHFVPKSVDVGSAYRWRNFRFACNWVNLRKGVAQDVLDPFTLRPGTFTLSLGDGSMAAASTLCEVDRLRAQQTIARLQLNHSLLRRRRLEDWRVYIKYRCEEVLVRTSPFVWHEARRQGLL